MRILMLFRRNQAAKGLDQELRFHIEQQIAENRAAGMSADESRTAALRAFGNPALLRDQARATWSWNWLERFVLDLAYTLRHLRRSPGFTFAVVLTLALGLGATAAMFTLVDRVMLRPLPYRNARQLVQIKEAGKKGVVQWGSPFLDVQQWRQRSQTLSDIGFYAANPDRPSFLQGQIGAEQVVNARISGNLLSTLGVAPAMGRAFAAQSETGSAQPADAQSIILSDTAWRSFYGGDAEIVGKVVKLNGKPYSVVGIMPRGFTFPFGVANPVVWTAVVLGDKDAVRTRHDTPDYGAIARLKPGADLAAAEAELKVIQTEVAKAYSDPADRERVQSIRVERYGDSLVSSEMTRALLALCGAAAVLWLIGCVNATSLLLARSTARQREIAVRGALGASRWRIVQQFLAEGLVLSGIASVLGLGLAVLVLRFFQRELAIQFNIHAALTPNATVIGALIGLTLISTLISSVWPAIGAARASIEPALRQGGALSGTGRAQRRLRAVLMVSEIALSLTLLVGCGLLLRTIYALRHVPLGFQTDHVIVANMTIPAYDFDGKDMTTQLYQPLLQKVQRLPGVQSASLMTQVPLGKTFPMEFTFRVHGNTPAAQRQGNMRVEARAVGPDMQKVLGFRMLYGRFFDQTDTPTSQLGLVVNRAFAKEFLGDDQDLGKILGQAALHGGPERPSFVIGVMDDQRQVSVGQESRPEMEICLSQLSPDRPFYPSAEGTAMDLAVRTDRSPASIIPELRELMRNASPELATSNFTTMDQVAEDSYGSQRLAARLLQIFGGAALLLCISGIYGLLAYLVNQRTRELGLRIALGAQRGDVMGLVLRQAGWMLLAGSAIGLILAYFSSLLLRSFLYGVQPHDPLTVGAATLTLLACGLASAWLPARRAAGVDPMQALKTE
jgi:predicted permease